MAIGIQKWRVESSVFSTVFGPCLSDLQVAADSTPRNSFALSAACIYMCCTVFVSLASLVRHSRLGTLFLGKNGSDSRIFKTHGST